MKAAAIEKVLAVLLFAAGLYVTSFHSGTNWFYLGLVATIAGGWRIGMIIKNGKG